MALSQLLEDSPLRWAAKRGGHGELYDERHRLALEELLSGGPGQFLDFLQRESIPNFLSQDEIRWLRSSAVGPRCMSRPGEDDPGVEQSLRSSADCSSATYFPEVSDLEPPVLELGWPAFTTGSYRGATRAVAHFQPSYGECIYGCKEAARRLINGAKEVIAIVTDSLTDLDIFKELCEACTHRGVPVYILLDQSSVMAFLQMCASVGAHLDELQKMRVRTITGTTYYMRSGGRVTGEVHERFMLIDGIKVATGSYRFNWTDGKINSSNLVELSGQITEKFDEEFRVLYAQSLPLAPHAPPLPPHSAVHEQLRLQLTPPPHTARGRPAEAACLTSTPTRAVHTTASTLGRCQVEAAPEYCTTTGGSWKVEELEEELLAGSTSRHLPHFHLPLEEPCKPSSRHASTQTSHSVTGNDTRPPSSSSSSSSSSGPPREIPPTERATNGLHEMSVERQRLYSSIRNKLEQTVVRLSAKRELADIGVLAEGLLALSRQRAPEPNSWPGATCAGWFSV